MRYPLVDLATKPGQRYRHGWIPVGAGSSFGAGEPPREPGTSEGKISYDANGNVIRDEAGRIAYFKNDTAAKVYLAKREQKRRKAAAPKKATPAPAKKVNPYFKPGSWLSPAAVDRARTGGTNAPGM